MREPIDLRDDAALDAILGEMREARDGAAPFTVDVADRVMARIAFAGPVPRSEVGLAQLGRWLAAAAVAGIALLTSAASRVPDIPNVVGEVGMTAAEGTTLAVQTGGTMTVLASSLAKTGVVLFEAARATVEALAPVQAAFGALVTLSVLFMLGVTAYVVGRDLRTTTR
jgi:hypothetical protein